MDLRARVAALEAELTAARDEIARLREMTPENVGAVLKRYSDARSEVMRECARLRERIRELEAEQRRRGA